VACDEDNEQNDGHDEHEKNDDYPRFVRYYKARSKNRHHRVTGPPKEQIDRRHVRFPGVLAERHRQFLDIT
jgi:hypothetical protein